MNISTLLLLCLAGPQTLAVKLQSREDFSYLKVAKASSIIQIREQPDWKQVEVAKGYSQQRNREYGLDQASFRGRAISGEYACGMRANAAGLISNQADTWGNDRGLQGLTLIFCNVAAPERRFSGPRDEVMVAHPPLKRNAKGEAPWSSDEHSLCPKGQFISEIDVRFQEWKVFQDNQGVDGIKFRCSRVRKQGKKEGGATLYDVLVPEKEWITPYEGHVGKWLSETHHGISPFSSDLENYLISAAKVGSDVDLNDDVGVFAIILATERAQLDPRRAGVNMNPIIFEWKLIMSGSDIEDTLTEEFSSSSSDKSTTTSAKKISANLSCQFPLAGSANKVDLSSEMSETQVDEIQSLISQKSARTFKHTCKGVNMNVFQWTAFQKDQSENPGFKASLRYFKCLPAGLVPRCPVGFCADANCQVCRQGFSA